MNKEQTLKDVAKLIKKLTPLVEEVLSDKFTPQERNALRNRLIKGQDYMIFNLSNLIAQLCTETARKIIGERLKKERALRERLLKK